VNAETDLLERTLDTILGKHCTPEARADAAAGAVPAALWDVLAAAGLTDLAAPETGAGLPDLVALAVAVGRAAAPVPLVEASGISPWLLGSAGIGAPQGITTCAVGHRKDHLRVERAVAGWRVHGVLHRVPWGAAADHVAALAHGPEGPCVVVVGGVPSGAEAEPSRNLADEPRDTVRVDAVVPESAVGSTVLRREDLLRRGALLRAAMIAGAMGRVLDLALAHAAVREQFGRPIADFQAVQHHLVAVAEEAACTDAAVRAAALAGPEDLAFAVASAKVTASSGAAVVARRSHQVFGAIGATEEHSLHWYSKRLWSYQDEFGTERTWSRAIGRGVLAGGADALWPTISAPLGDHALEVAP
jgi:acyl-CoA dehydrogenase